MNIRMYKDIIISIQVKDDELTTYLATENLYALYIRSCFSFPKNGEYVFG